MPPRSNMAECDYWIWKNPECSYGKKFDGLVDVSSALNINHGSRLCSKGMMVQFLL